MLLVAAALPAAVLASGGSGSGGSGSGGSGTGGSGTSSGVPGPCLTINVLSPSFTFNVGGDVTLKADVVNCSSDTTAPQLVVMFRTIAGGAYWCVYPNSGGNPPNFTLLPGSTKAVSCTQNAAIAGSFAGLPADAQVFANCLSFSTQQDGPAIANLDGSFFLPPDQGFTNSSCTLLATSNTYTVVSGINPNGVPRK